jgi:Uma2 family endonuclease
MPPSGGGASSLGIRLGAAIINFVQAHTLGYVTGADGEYVLSRPGESDTAFAPDVAYVAMARAPQPGTPEWERAWRLAPDLAVEIASPNQYRPEMAENAKVYLDAGARLVWVV